MICTFGDTTDVTWWRELQLPTRADHRPRRPDPARDPGRGSPRRPAARPTPASPARPSFTAQKRDGRAARASRVRSSASPSRSTHPVKFYEKGDRPLEIVTTRQWYIRNGGRDADLRERLVARGAEICLAPAVHAAALRELGARASTATG